MSKKTKIDYVVYVDMERHVRLKREGGGERVKGGGVVKGATNQALTNIVDE